MTGRPLSRRALLLATGGFAAGVAGLGVDAFRWAPRRVQVTRHDVAVPGLPAALAGLTILHLSDLHLYDGLHPAARRAMELAAALGPDVTIATGDLVEHASQLPEAAAWLRACRGRLATAVTFGNWEYHARVTPAAMRRAAGQAGATFLCNESLTIGDGAARLTIVGLDDPRAGVPAPAEALREAPEGVPRIWAFHAPGYADRLLAQEVPRPFLALAGHTHGGQIRPPFVPAITPPGSGRFLAGWYGDTFAPFYVSRGIGTSGIRARFRCPPELALFTLHPA